MRRIHITGNAGVGKTTVAERIGMQLSLPVFSLDAIVWKERWEKRAPDERQARERELCAHPSWVIDGVSRIVRDSADAVVFLDYPRSVSYWRCARRNWRYLFSSRPGLPTHCPEIVIVPTLIRIIWRFPSRVRPAILAWRDRASDVTFVHIRSNRELEAFLQDIGHSTMGEAARRRAAQST